MAELKHNTFSSVSNYVDGLRHTPQRLRRRAIATVDPQEELTLVKGRSKVEMKKSLEWYDMISFGVGSMVGAGIFVSTGYIANQVAGPAVLLSYVVSGISALLSALCYSEFAVETPVAGGAFSYLRITLGEFAAYITAANLIMEYILSAAAVARGFTSYFPTVFGNTNSNAWRIHISGVSADYSELDLPAVALIILLTLLICYGTKESSLFNLVTTVIHLVFIAFIIVAGLAKGNANNMTSPDGFAPFGARGIFDGAAIAYFSYIGYDAVATMSEECRDPKTSVPIGIVGSVCITVVIYCLMCLAICFLQPYTQIDPNAPFSIAFSNTGWDWAVNFIGVGAILGVITSTLMALLGQARYMTVIGRTHLVPFWFASINPKTNTPINATVFLSTITAIIAFFTDFSVLINMVSIGTLFVFYMVAQALVFRRHYKKGVNSPIPTLLYLTFFSTCGIGFSAYYQVERDQYWGLLLCGIAAIVGTLVFYFLCPQVHMPPEDCFAVPLMPFMAAASIFLNIFLLGTLDTKSYERFGIFSAAAILLYVLYGVHATWDVEEAERIDGEFEDVVKPVDSQKDVEGEEQA